MSFADVDDKVVEAVVMRRVFWRLMPFLLGAYLPAPRLDRRLSARLAPECLGWGQAPRPGRNDAG